MIREEEPPRPSMRLSSTDTLPSLAKFRHTDPARLKKLMRGELDWIVMKAMEKDHTRRYETASGLARDIERYLDDEVVEAHPPSTGYRMGKFVRRHRAQVIAAELVLLALLAGIAGTTWGLIREARAKSRLAKSLAREQKTNRAVLAVREALAAEPGADAGITADVGRSLMVVASLLGGIGKKGEALAAYRRTESVLAVLAGTDPPARAALANCRTEMAHLLLAGGRPDEALARPAGKRRSLRRSWRRPPGLRMTPTATSRPRSTKSALCCEGGES